MADVTVPDSPLAIYARYRDQLGIYPSPAHAKRLAELEAEHGSDWTLTINWDRYWGGREPGRFKVGHAPASLEGSRNRFLWAEFPQPEQGEDRCPTN